MEVTIRQEAGYDLALYGFSLSYKDRAVKPEDWWDFDTNVEYAEEFLTLNQDTAYDTLREIIGDECKDNQRELFERMSRTKATATANAGRGKGHDKFLRQIMVWVDIEAPRYFWSEFDTYKVGTVAQSESTMHTIMNRDVTPEDFAHKFYFSGAIEEMNLRREKGTNVHIQKGLLPESYLQRRLVTLNYAVLRTIIEQRANHKLPEWATFIKAVYDQAEHKELLPKLEGA